MPRACAPETFDERGTWHEPAVHPPFDNIWYSQVENWYCPIREWNLPKIKFAERVGCGTTRNPHPRLWRSYDATGCPQTSAFDALLPNSTTFFIGDSMSHQHWNAVACRLLYEGMRLAGCHPSACRDFARAPTASPDVRCSQRGCGLELQYPANMYSPRWRAPYQGRQDELSHDCAQFSFVHVDPPRHYMVCGGVGAVGDGTAFASASERGHQPAPRALPSTGTFRAHGSSGAAYGFAPNASHPVITRGVRSGQLVTVHRTANHGRSLSSVPHSHLPSSSLHLLQSISKQPSGSHLPSHPQPSGSHLSHRTSPAAAISGLVRLRLLQPSDVLVVNSGLTASGHDLERTLRPLAEQLRTLRAQRAARILWRETSPQHFPKPADHGPMADGSKADFFLFGSGAGGDNMYHKQMSEDYKRHGQCDPAANSTHRPPLAQRDLALFEEAGVPLLKIWFLSASQHDVHRALYTSWAHTKGALDCTHFCVPSGVMEAWTDALFNSLAWYRWPTA